MNRPHLRIPASAGAMLGALALVGCAVSPSAQPSGLYARPIGNAPVVANPTPYTPALVCLGDHARAANAPAPRIAVGRILDYTGKEDFEGGRKITQGASLMAMSAFAKAGARLVERFDTSVSELELKYANNKLIGDADTDYRKILAGSVPGSDYYLVGGVTELNYNIRSSGLDAFGGDVDASDPKGRINAKIYVMNIGLDLRLVDTRSLEVIDVISYQKQILGREVGAGVFTFFGDNVIDIGVGGRAQEPVQLAVRAVVERAVLEMMTNLYGASGPSACAGVLRADPLATNGATGDFIPAYDNLETNNALTRDEARRWHPQRDPDMRAALKGRTE